MAHGNEHIPDEVNIDYFTVSLPELLIFSFILSKINSN